MITEYINGVMLWYEKKRNKIIVHNFISFNRAYMLTRKEYLETDELFKEVLKEKGYVFK
jgi:hypothetical protein